ncbi:phosphoenolpyruvate-protein phosphotransferase [Sorangium cellulosum]|uniref:Phosphoenolpyruvate-protein phosphotransferase n=1 Tax=Sorangium cellulosum TaxID=56 RepID=A0A4P2PY04_SORCE|nr:phosphoenolpyruvate--protein phosphotransferase [Sorangium cellulosum]AUX21724.1 phosphoenolpyruvate-protein phosphotransferase [Sorangium cellulosum]
MSAAASRVGLVLVSHSRALAEATVALARQMTGDAVAIACAAGAGEGGAELGTDAVAIAAAIERVCGPAGAVVLMDLGSAILSAETALELVDPSFAARTRLTGGPLVEGAVAAAVRAASGGALDQVAAEARQALAAKAAQLGEAAPPAGAADAPAPAAPLAGAPVAAFAAPAAPLAATPAAPSAAAAPFASADVTLADPSGLHARPAAQLVARAASFDAAITVEDLTTGLGPVPASSLIALSSLGARRGDVLRLRATGREAADAVAALAALVALPGREAAAGPPAARAVSGRAIPVAPGIALGPLVRLTRSLPPIPEAAVDDPAAEVERLRRALAQAAQDLGSALRGSDILEAHQALLADPALVGAAVERIERDRCTAAWAFGQAIEAAVSIYQQLDNPYLRAREADVRDVGDAVLRALLGGAAAALPEGPPAIVVADDLTPSEAARLDASRVLGVIDRRGGPSSHAAILLRGAGIPAVAGAAALVPEAGGAQAALDGATGEIWIDPDPRTAEELARRQAASRAARGRPRARAGRVRLACGREIELWANVAGLSDARAAREAGALGIGLLRTEMLFLDRREAPGEDEQAELLAQIFAVFAGAPIVVRTLDAGGDKALAYLDLEAEANPSLGVRGVRLSLARPALLEAQLRATLVAARGHDVRVMIPMVSTAAEVTAVRAALERAHEALDAAGRPHLWPVPAGIMVEVPAAALMAERLARRADFFSVGTNDLTQYTLAAERGHPRLHALADPAHPAVLRLVRAVVEAGLAAARPVSVCGEAAGDPQVAPLLAGLGVTRLSMCASAFDAVEDALAAASFAALAAAAEEALAVDDAASARAAMRRTG